jgi:hydrogenase expression/formation protein HypD
MKLMNYLEEIKKISQDMNSVKIMEVCGGHTNTIVKFGLRDVLPSNIKLISGPGCPVCVTSQKDIDSVIEIALKGVKIGTYGDMINVPGTKMSLKDAQALGADVKTIYSVDQIMNDKERVFFAVGFETTTPMTAKLLANGITVFCAHKTMPEVMKLVVKDMDIQGFIDPGHVSTIIGSNIWEELDLGVPQVISGFKPDQLVKATYELLKLIKENKSGVINDYTEVVSNNGNELAKKLIDENLVVDDSEWRGMGVINGSGLKPKNPKLDARIKFKEIIEGVKSEENPDCRCGEVVKGLIEPKQCKLFGKECTLSTPKGACMVSETEGACAIAFKYGSSLGE